MPDDVLLDPEVRALALRYFAAVELSPLPASITTARPWLERERRGFGVGRGLATVAVFAAMCVVLTVVVVVGRNVRSIGTTPTAQGGPPPGPSSRVCPSPGAIPRNGPKPPRSAAAMAYDDATGDVVLFGGDTDNGYGVALADTWIWNGTTWSQRVVNPSPPGRIGAAMAYDAASKQLVLFSGIGTSGAPEDDTWIWNGVAWHEVQPATSPPPRTDAAIAYDPAIKKIVMFGGWQPGENAKYSDTWTWDGTSWTELSPLYSAPPTAEAVMAYDAVSHFLVMFGGLQSGPTNQTWAFDDGNWSAVTFSKGATQPPARDATVMALDGANRTIVLFGGEENRGAANDTWTWNGSEWMQMHPRNVPPARGVEDESGMMTYDSKLGVDVLYGGPIDNPQESLGDTWTWNGTNWTEVSNNGPAPPVHGRC
jgi:hypothetical protein